MSERATINEYLFYEFGYDLKSHPSEVTDNWPFELQLLGTIRSGTGKAEVFSFVADDEAYFALSAEALTFYRSDGMTLTDLQLQQDGAAWLALHEPIDLATSYIGNDSIPPAAERRAILEEFAMTACESPRILQGLYLRTLGTYIALVENTVTRTGLITGTGIQAPQYVGFPQASSWRRLAYGVGKLLEQGALT